MEVSGQLHDSAALPWGRSPHYPLDRRLGGPQRWSIIIAIYSYHSGPPWSNFWQGEQFFLFITGSRVALGPTHLPM